VDCDEDFRANDEFRLSTNDAADELIVPQVIRPNGPGLNQSFTIEGATGIGPVRVTIYNILGQVVYYESDYGSVPAWNGEVQNYRTGYSSATYYYFIEQSGMKPQSGYIQVLR
jgi:hypothetical protein